MSDFFDRILTPQPAQSEMGALPVNEPDGSQAISDAASAPAATDPALATTAASLKSAVQDLLRCGLIERDAKPNLYRVLTGEPAVARILEPFDLSLTVDDVRGIAFLVVPPQVAATPDEAWQHPLVRRLRLTTEQSLLVAILRQAHIAYEQQHGIGAAGAKADVDELLAQFDLYLGDSGSESRNRERLLRVLGQLQAHGIVSEPDKDQQVSIRPIIVHLANPEHLQLLLRHFKQLAETSTATHSAPADSETTDSNEESTTDSNTTDSSAESSKPNPE